MAKTVKARVHHGADSLDLTIPADVVREFDVNSGDIFEVVISDDESLEIKYERVYESG
jgi:antitoxin component of MazEF toxin-antitoxin module